MASESSAERHSGALQGGYKELESQDVEARDAAAFAVEQLSAQANSLQPWRLNKVLSDGRDDRTVNVDGPGSIWPTQPAIGGEGSSFFCVT